MLSALYGGALFLFGVARDEKQSRHESAVERALVQACDLDVLNDRDTIEVLLDELHMRAYPDPTRPARLVAYDGEWHLTE